MRNLFQFIFRNVHWLLFCVLVYLSVLLIVKNNQFQRSKYLRIAQEVTGSIFSVTNYFHSYFYLRSANADLSERVAKLETEVYAYREQLSALRNDSSRVNHLIADQPVYRFVSARVVNNSVSFLENYMMLDKGSDDGVRSDMGVLSVNGVVGVVIDTSPHFSLVISLLNTKYKLNGKIKRSDFFGPLVWDGKDAQYTCLTEIPRYVAFEPGDTVVTSGYSTVFPHGIPIGSIVDAQKQRDDNYISLRIRLFTNFNNLNEVMIVTNRFQEEQKELEERTLNRQTTY
ncbi:MAG: rod shape-determining protein MreC [Dysgonamonadaceae bacterium]|nr:rod shape-determining protein MreC [Dysgonamonadaceae bacterium]